MSRLSLRAPIAAGLVALLAACSNESSTAPAAPAADGIAVENATAPVFSRTGNGATVYVVHGIDGRDLGADQALPVDVSVNGACALTGFTFKTIAGPLALPAGDYAIAISLANPAAPCSNAPVIQATVPFADGERASVVAHLTEAGAPTASKFENPRPFIFPAVAARHTAAFSAVDLIVARGGRTKTFGGLTNGNQVAGFFFPGKTTFAIAPAGTTTKVFEAPVVLKPFTTYAFYAVGTPAKGTFDVIVQEIARK